MASREHIDDSSTPCDVCDMGGVFTNGSCTLLSAQRRGCSIALRAHALGLQLALALQVGLVGLVRVRVQSSYDAQHLRPPCG